MFCFIFFMPNLNFGSCTNAVGLSWSLPVFNGGKLQQSVPGQRQHPGRELHLFHRHPARHHSVRKALGTSSQWTLLICFSSPSRRKETEIAWLTSAHIRNFSCQKLSYLFFFSKAILSSFLQIVCVLFYYVFIFDNTLHLKMQQKLLDADLTCELGYGTNNTLQVPLHYDDDKKKASFFLFMQWRDCWLHRESLRADSVHRGHTCAFLHVVKKDDRVR